MTKLIELIEGVHAKVLLAMSVTTLLNNPIVSRLWEESSKKEKERLSKLIKELDRDGIHIWIVNHPSIHIGEMSIRQLQRIARDLCVINYSRLSKSELIREIEGVKYEKG